MALQSMTVALLFVAALCTSVVVTQEDGAGGQSMDCTTYVNITTTSALCNNLPDVVCSGGCTGYATATKCTTSQVFGDQSGPLTTEKCTVSYGPTSAAATICNNEKSFTCYGPVTGTAQCKGCKRSTDKPSDTPLAGGLPGNSSTSTPGTNSTSTPGNTTSTSGNNSTCSTGRTSVNASGKKSDSTSGGTAGKAAGATGTTPPPASGSTDSPESQTTSAGTLLSFNGASLALATLLFSMTA